MFLSYFVREGFMELFPKSSSFENTKDRGMSERTRDNEECKPVHYGP